MEKFDIKVTDDILVYDDFSVIGSSRLYWMFKNYSKNIVVMNGTIRDWSAEGFETEKNEVTYKPR